MPLSFYRISAFFAGEFTSHQPVVGKILKIWAIPVFFATGFDSGLVFVIFYSLLILVLCDQLLILIIIFHSCFLSKEKLLGFWPSYPWFFFFLLALVVCSTSIPMRTLKIISQSVIKKQNKQKNYTIPWSF